MNITKTEGLGAQGYPVFNIDGTKIDPNGHDIKVAGSVYSLSNNMYQNKGFGGLTTEEDIITAINEGSNGHGTPSKILVAKAFPDHIAKYLLNAE